ncbi:hypothetical protein H5T58_03595, partial [Candidatus Parcubacteria bacterium]|nr:hypothetical protein [Candidatus Parcubacteria bacterium]
MRNKNLVFSLICGFLSGVFVLGIIFNPTISEFEKMPILLLIKRFWWTLLIFLPISFTLAILIGALFVKKIPIFFQFIKFVEIGVLNTFLDLGILNY